MALIHSPGIVTNGLALCLDASNIRSYPGSGSSWFDISGSGRTFNWVSAPSTGVDTIPYFSTINNRCIGPASNSFGINNTSGYTIFLMMKQLSLVATAAFKFYKNNASGSSGRGIFSHCSWVDDIIYFDQGGFTSPGDSRTFVASGGLTDWNIIAFRRLTGSSTRSIIKNGSVLVTNTLAASTLDLDGRGVDLGSSDEYGGNSSTWNARLNSFVVYNRGLSDAEVQQNFTALRRRFSIS